MDLIKLNKLVEKASLISKHLEQNGRDSLLEESLSDYIAEIKVRYSSFLNEKLFGFYEDYFENNEIEKLENYLISEVQVFGSELDMGDLLIGIKASPLRIELYDHSHSYHNILWKAA